MRGLNFYSMTICHTFKSVTNSGIFESVTIFFKNDQSRLKSSKYYKMKILPT